MNFHIHFPISLNGNAHAKLEFKDVETYSPQVENLAESGTPRV